LRMLFSIAVTLCSFAMAGFNWNVAWVTFMLFPFGTIPFTYVTSFAFSGEASAATVTIFINFASITLIPSLMFYLRWLRELEFVADTINMLFRCFPAYNLGASIFLNALNENLAEYREATEGTGYDISVNPWHITQTSADIVIMLGHFCLWMGILCAIEMGAGKKIRSWWVAKQKNKFPPPDKNLEMDEDVLEEERRVAKTPDHNL